MARKMTRKEMREHLYRMLFRMDYYTPEELPGQLKLYLEELPQASDAEKQELQERFLAVSGRAADLDVEIGKRAKGWQVQRLAKTDLTVLRLGLYELKYDEAVPTGVAINEAVELAKAYGGEKSVRFVNGVLAAAARELQKD